MNLPYLEPKMEQSGDVTIITLAGGSVRGEQNMIAAELEGRLEGVVRNHLLLDFSNVEYVTSVELGTLITLHKVMRNAGGRLTLFNLNDQVYEVFTVTHLQTLLGICR